MSKFASSLLLCGKSQLFNHERPFKLILRSLLQRQKILRCEYNSCSIFATFVNPHRPLIQSKGVQNAWNRDLRQHKHPSANYRFKFFSRNIPNSPDGIAKEDRCSDKSNKGSQKDKPCQSKTDAFNGTNPHNHPWITESQLKAMLEQMKTTANKITITRILATPVLGYWIINDQSTWALAGCFVAAASDYLDGYIAKHYNQRTVLGTFLDPLADKFSIATLSIALAYKQILPPEVVALWFTRDALLIGFTYYYIRLMTKEGEAVMDPSKTPVQADPTTISKVNTALQFFTIACGLAQPVFEVPDAAVLYTLR